MPRYIDADALIKKIFPYDVIDKNDYSINANAIYRAIEDTPTENVTTMKEAAKEIFAAIEFDIRNLDLDREETRAIAIEGVIAILKKIYTEGEPNG